MLPPEELEKRGVGVYKTERGGDVTFHGPGQLVAYPIIDLRAFGLGAKSYVRGLEETIIRLLTDYDMKGVTMEKFPGVWAYGGKIASIGVSVRNGITMHGCAFNVNTDLSYFSMIIPCGLEGVMITSLKDILGEEIDFGAVMRSFVRHFGEVFNAEMREIGHEVRERIITLNQIQCDRMKDKSHPNPSFTTGGDKRQEILFSPFVKGNVFLPA